LEEAVPTVHFRNSAAAKKRGFLSGIGCIAGFRIGIYRVLSWSQVMMYYVQLEKLFFQGIILGFLSGPFIILGSFS